MPRPKPPAVVSVWMVKNGVVIIIYPLLSTNRLTSKLGYGTSILVHPQSALPIGCGNARQIHSKSDAHQMQSKSLTPLTTQTSSFICNRASDHHPTSAHSCCEAQQVNHVWRPATRLTHYTDRLHLSSDLHPSSHPKRIQGKMLKIWSMVSVAV